MSKPPGGSRLMTHAATVSGRFLAPPFFFFAMRRSPPSVCDTAPVRFNALAWRPFGSWFLKAESFGSLGKVLKKGTEKTLPCRLPVGSGTLAFPTAVYPYTLGGWGLCHRVGAELNE